MKFAQSGFCSLPLSSLLPSFLSSGIRYGWFWLPLLEAFAHQKQGYPDWPSRRTRGIRASDLEAPSLNCLVVHSSHPRKIQNPNSGIQNQKFRNPKSKLFWPDFGDFVFWTLDFGLLCSNSSCEAPAGPVLDFGFGILDCGSWILDFEPNFGPYIR